MRNEWASAYYIGWFIFVFDMYKHNSCVYVRMKNEAVLYKVLENRNQGICDYHTYMGNDDLFQRYNKRVLWIQLGRSLWLFIYWFLAANVNHNWMWHTQLLTEFNTPLFYINVLGHQRKRSISINLDKSYLYLASSSKPSVIVSSL